MPTYRDHLPQLDADVFLADGGLETSLIYDDGIDLPDFAAFVLLDSVEGRTALRRYFERYVEIARRDGRGIVLETPTWRASADWGARQGRSVEQVAEANRAAVDLLVEVRDAAGSSVPVVISGCIGPRGDGYRPEELMTAGEAAAYHALQAEAFAGTEADLITGITMTSAAEAIGVAEAARSVGMPVVISFTVETDGRLPSGQRLGAAIVEVDEATAALPAYYMVNCAHPTHFADALDSDEPWVRRIGGIRANASTMSHEELDNATELDAGDPVDLAERYRELRDSNPVMRVFGGCCGTNHHHVDAISTTLRPAIAD